MTYERLDKNKKALYKKLAVVAVPIALQSLIGSSLNLVDNLMVGSLGETELAAVGVGVQIYTLFYLFIYGFASGCSTFMAQFWGSGNVKGIKKAMGFTFVVCFSIGILFFLAAEFFPEKIMRIFTNIPEVIAIGKVYIQTCAPSFLLMPFNQSFEISLRATQQTHLPLIASIAAFCTNTSLNYVFIFGHFGAPALGVKGAATATVIARIIQLSILLFIVFVRKNIVAGTPREYFGWTPDFRKRVLRNSIPTTLNESLWSLGTSMYVAAFARVGITEYAAVQAGNTIQNVFIMAAFSLSDAALILVGQKLGQKKLDEAVILTKKLLRIGALIGFIFGLVLIAVSKPLISLFDFTPLGEKYTFYILIVLGLTMALPVYNVMIVSGVLRAGGDTKFAMLGETGTIWLYAVPVAFITALYLHWPIYFCILAVKGEEIIKCVIMTARVISKKWVKNVVTDL